MKFDRNFRSNPELFSIYRSLIIPRLIEEKMLLLLRQGKISKWFSGIGQEAVSVGAALAMDPEEYILPMHRNLGIFTVRNVPLKKLFSQFQGKIDGYTKGRDRSFHFGTNKHKLVGMISHLGPQMGVADGIALAYKLKKEKKAVLVVTGDGGSSEGDFHESINVAAVWKLPVIFLIENNGYGLSTPNHQQFNFQSFTNKGVGYGIEAYSMEGNSILEVLNTLEPLLKDVRNRPRPILIEALTFRMRGHEEASGTKYVPQELMNKWAKKDPISNYEKFLLKEKVCTQQALKQIHSDVEEEINEAVKESFSEPDIQPHTETEIKDVYSHFIQKIHHPKPATSEKRMVDAISDALRIALKTHGELVLMGQDIEAYGGVFKVTQGFLEEFGADRVRNTPLCESAIVGTTLGLSIARMKAVVEMQFADFVTEAFNQIINNLAKTHYRWGQSVDVVIRMPTGAGVNAGPFHSQSNEAWFFHTPGLKIVYPSNPIEAKGLLLAAIEDPNPYLYFEHKYLYRTSKEQVPDGYYTIEVGKANVVKEGKDIVIITYGMGVIWALQAQDKLDYAIEIIDLRTLLPWDKDTVVESVKKIGKVLVLHEDCLTGGIGAEIAAWINEYCFQYLDAPIMREGALDTPVPFAKFLEENFLPYHRFLEKIKLLVRY